MNISCDPVHDSDTSRVPRRTATGKAADTNQAAGDEVSSAGRGLGICSIATSTPVKSVTDESRVSGVVPTSGLGQLRCPLTSSVAWLSPTQPLRLLPTHPRLRTSDRASTNVVDEWSTKLAAEVKADNLRNISYNFLFLLLNLNLLSLKLY